MRWFPFERGEQSGKEDFSNVVVEMKRSKEMEDKFMEQGADIRLSLRMLTLHMQVLECDPSSPK